MAAYRRVYNSRHLQADCQEPGSARNPTLCSRVWATFTFLAHISVEHDLKLQEWLGKAVCTNAIDIRRIKRIGRLELVDDRCA